MAYDPLWAGQRRHLDKLAKEYNAAVKAKKDAEITKRIKAAAAEQAAIKRAKQKLSGGQQRPGSGGWW